MNTRLGYFSLLTALTLSVAVIYYILNTETQSIPTSAPNQNPAINIATSQIVSPLTQLHPQPAEPIFSSDVQISSEPPLSVPDSIQQPTPDTQFLKMLILSATPFDIDDTARITNPGVFIDKLNSIIEGNFYETEYLQNPLRYPPIEFLGGDASSMAFSNVDGKVFINFKLQGYAGNDVLIKWYNPTTGKILGFKKHNIEPSHTNHPIWLEN